MRDLQKAYKLFHSVYQRYLRLDNGCSERLKRIHKAFECVYTEYDPYHDSCFHEIMRERARLKARSVRIRRYVADMLRQADLDCYSSGSLYLMSLTFSDEVLGCNNRDSLQVYVKRYLHDVTADYIACVDFGKVNGRIHYHAIVRFDPLVESSLYSFKKRHKLFCRFINPLLDWSYGFYSIRPIGLSSSDSLRSVAYAFKSSAYAFKSSNVDVKPFHKRGVPRWVELADPCCIDIIIADGD